MAIILILLFSSCATPGRTGIDDPREEANRARFASSDAMDTNVMVPLSQSYINEVPEALRRGINNFFNNLFYTNTMLNNFLQGKLIAGTTDLGRIAINSTLGLGGLFDVASAMDIPVYREDLGQTLAIWGVGSGDYLFLPVFGPYTERYVPDLVMSGFLNPLFYSPVAVMVPLSALHLLNRRSELLTQTEARDDSALDRYLFTRDAFIQQREFMIYDGRTPTSSLDDFFDL